MPLNWHIDGTGDFNGDRKSDILWRNDAGLVAVWDMDGNRLVLDLFLLMQVCYFVVQDFHRTPDVGQVSMDVSHRCIHVSVVHSSLNQMNVLFLVQSGPEGVA